MKKVMAIVLALIFALGCTQVAFADSERLDLINGLVDLIPTAFTSEELTVTCAYSQEADALLVQVDFANITDEQWNLIKTDKDMRNGIYDACSDIGELFAGLVEVYGLDGLVSITVLATNTKTTMAIFIDKVNVSAMLDAAE